MAQDNGQSGLSTKTAMTDKSLARERAERTRTWPKFTPVQRALLVRFDRSKYGDLYISGMTLRSLWTLLAEGMVSGNGTMWYSITQRGRDYVRFGLPKPRRAR